MISAFARDECSSPEKDTHVTEEQDRQQANHEMIVENIGFLPHKANDHAHDGGDHKGTSPPGGYRDKRTEAFDP